MMKTSGSASAPKNTAPMTRASVTHCSSTSSPPAECSEVRGSRIDSGTMRSIAARWEANTARPATTASPPMRSPIVAPASTAPSAEANAQATKSRMKSSTDSSRGRWSASGSRVVSAVA